MIFGGYGVLFSGRTGWKFELFSGVWKGSNSNFGVGWVFGWKWVLSSNFVTLFGFNYWTSMQHYLVGMGQGPAQSPTFEEGLKHELWMKLKFLGSGPIFLGPDPSLILSLSGAQCIVCIYILTSNYINQFVGRKNDLKLIPWLVHWIFLKGTVSPNDFFLYKVKNYHLVGNQVALNHE